MTDQEAPLPDARRSPRLRVPPAYSLVRVRRAGDRRYRWTGYVYDVSASGMRLELDEPLPPGSAVELSALLPGRNHIVFEARGTVVRIHDNEVGPIRLAVHFDTFRGVGDQQRLADYLNENHRIAA